MDKKVWYITGASRGLGLALIKKLLKEGHQVAASSGTLPALVEAVGKDHPDFLPLEVDLSDESSVGASISATHQHFGRIDVVVNNAGFGIGGSVLVIQNVMPYLRAQGSGHIINIVSIAGLSHVQPNRIPAHPSSTSPPSRSASSARSFCQKRSAPQTPHIFLLTANSPATP